MIGFIIFLGIVLIIIMISIIIENKTKTPTVIKRSRRIDWDKVKTAKDITYILSHHNLFSNLQVDEDEWKSFEKYLSDEVSEVERIDWVKVNKK